MKKKVLAIAPWVPASERPRSYGLLKLLSEKAEVHLVAACWDDQELYKASKLDFLRVLPVQMSKGAAVSRTLSAPLTKDSLQQRYVGTGRLKRAASFVREEIKPDFLYFNVLRSTQIRIDDREKLPEVVDLDEYRSQFYEHVSRSSKNPKNLVIGAVEKDRMARSEAEVERRFRKILVSSPLDMRSTRNALVRSPHVLRSDISWSYEKAEPFSIVMVGRMCYSANVEAVSYFARRVFPLIQGYYPQAHFNIVGADPTAEVRSLQNEHITVHGRVPDVTPFYSGAAVSVVPVTQATGVQMKLIESLSVGVPTVSTRLCLQQAGIESGRQCLAADSPVEWLRQLSRIFDSSHFSTQLSVEGRKWAAEHYSTDSIRGQLDGALADLL